MHGAMRSPSGVDALESKRTLDDRHSERAVANVHGGPAWAHHTVRAVLPERDHIHAESVPPRARRVATQTDRWRCLARTPRQIFEPERALRQRPPQRVASLQPHRYCDEPLIGPE